VVYIFLLPTLPDIIADCRGVKGGGAGIRIGENYGYQGFQALKPQMLNRSAPPP